MVDEEETEKPVLTFDGRTAVFPDKIVNLQPWKDGYNYMDINRADSL